MIELPEHDLTAYRADPPGEVRGAVVVIQEIWGLADHIIDVADRFAEQGYVAVAPDLLGHVGLTKEVGAELQQLDVGRRGHPHRRPAAPARGDGGGPVARVRGVGRAGPAVGRRPAARAGGRRRRRRGRRLLLRRVLQLLARPRRAEAAGGRRLLRHLPRVAATPPTIGCPVLAFYGEETTASPTACPTSSSAWRRRASTSPPASTTASVTRSSTTPRPRATTPRRRDDAWSRTLDFLGRHH